MPDRALLEVYRPYIRAALSSEDRKVFDQINFRFPDSINHLHVRAVTWKGKRYVDISKGYLQILLSFATAVVHEQFFKPKRGLLSYFFYLKRSMGTAAIKFEKGDGPLPMFEAYYVWAGIAPDEANEVAKRERSRIVDLFSWGVLATILHESAHHIHGDTNIAIATLPDRELRDQEYRADVFTITTLRKMKLSASGLLPYFLYRAAIEGEVDEMYGDHDPTVCRLALFAAASDETEDKLWGAILERCDRSNPYRSPPAPAAR